MNLKKSLSNIFWSPFSSKQKIEKYQKIIRDYEWDDYKIFIPKGAKFLDVGCGAGDNLIRAQKELDCTVTGIDPDPGAHGVGRFHEEKSIASLNIDQGFAENLPYDDNSFDVVFSSHVLEHVNDEVKSLQEMKRVLKDDGVLIIGMPTSLMSYIALFSHFFFILHVKIFFALKAIGKKDFKKHFVNIFVPGSHSYPRAKTIFYDLAHYKVSNWEKIVSTTFKIEKKIEPYLYPYPDYWQFFKIHKSRLGGSSVFFICKK